MIARGTRVTLDVRDEGLLRGLLEAADARGVPLRAIVVEALQTWLESYQNAADHQVARERRDGPWVSLAALKARLSVPPG